MTFRYRAYSFFRKIVKQSWYNRLAKITPLLKVSAAYLRPNGKIYMERGLIKWREESFTFGAPIKVFHRAKTRGIENKICTILRNHLTTGDISIDVGSNYGFISILMAKKVAPEGVVYAFEIDPEIVGELSRTIESNGLSRSLRCSTANVGGGERGSVCLDELVPLEQQDRVRAIKIDTDGGDYDVLKGARNIIMKSRPLVIVEMEMNQAQIVEYFHSVGYECLVDLDLRDLVPGQYPNNLVAFASHDEC